MCANPLIVHDCTLRDGNHAVGHSLTIAQIARYAQLADAAGVDVIEVGHGNGIGASSIQVGISPISDYAQLSAARLSVTRALLGVHLIPGYAKLDDILKAHDIGVDLFRVGTHCTEADTASRYIEEIVKLGRHAHGVLMMSHMATTVELVRQAKILEASGAKAVVIMDSAGAYSNSQVFERILALTNELVVPIGFHGHNNLGLAVANTLVAYEAGARILDATICGFGAGAGNTPLELLIASLARMQLKSEESLFNVLQLCDEAKSFLVVKSPTASTSNIISGMYGIFSGFDNHVQRIASEFSVSPFRLYRELAKSRPVAGQEDLILEAAIRLLESSPKSDLNTFELR